MGVGLRHETKETSKQMGLPKMAGLAKSDIEDLLEEVFAPWVQDMGLEVIALTETGGRFRIPENPRLARGGGAFAPVVCGQALATAADTFSVMALCHLNQRFRNCTTVDLTTHFMRPLAVGPIEVTVEAVSNGRRMAVTRAEFRAEGSEKMAATATLAFAYLED